MLNGSLARSTVARGWRIGGSVIGTLAASALVIVGCTSATDGTAVVDAKDAPAFRTSMSSSLSESAASSSQRESQRQASLTTQAVHRSCDALSTSSVDAITAVNAYVAAVNEGGDVAARKGPAVDALNKSADLVSTSLGDALSAPLRDALTGYVNATRAVANLMGGEFSPEAFNTEVDKLNEARANAIGMCDAAY